LLSFCAVLGVMFVVQLCHRRCVRLKCLHFLVVFCPSRKTKDRQCEPMLLFFCSLL